MGPTVMYHRNCLDGFTAAWVARKVLGNRATYVPVQYNDRLPDYCPGQDAYLLDFSFPRAVLAELAPSVRRLVVLDHHESARDELQRFAAPNADVRFDMRQSGAGIAWSYFLDPERRSWLVDYVEDGDLWRFALPESKGIRCYLSAQEKSFERWDQLAAMQWQDVAAAGRTCWEQVQGMATAILGDGYRATFAGHQAFVVCMVKHHTNEVLHRALDDFPDVEVAVAWYQRADGMFTYSLRSREDGPRVNAIAAGWPRGGGHPHAAGFSTREMVQLVPLP